MMRCNSRKSTKVKRLVERVCVLDRALGVVNMSGKVCGNVCDKGDGGGMLVVTTNLQSRDERLLKLHSHHCYDAMPRGRWRDE